MQFPINSQNKLYYSIYVEHFSKKKNLILRATRKKQRKRMACNNPKGLKS